MRLSFNPDFETLFLFITIKNRCHVLKKLKIKRMKPYIYKDDIYFG